MARGVNKVILIGNAGADPDLRYTLGGTAVSNFSIATNESWTDSNGERQERTEWHRIVVWGRLAEICNQYLHKGSKVYIEGKLQTRSWEGQDGQKRYTTEVVARDMQLLDSHSDMRMDIGNGSEVSHSQNLPQLQTATPEKGDMTRQQINGYRGHRNKKKAKKDNTTRDRQVGLRWRRRGRNKKKAKKDNTTRQQINVKQGVRCDRCKVVIPKERLKAIPNARLCVTCQSRAEKIVGEEKERLRQRHKQWENRRNITGPYSPSPPT